MQKNVKWIIRGATPTDADGLKTCMQSAYANYQNRMGGERLPPMDADYAFEIRNYPAWVVESEGRIIGGLIMTFEKGRASIANIAVESAAQGKGVGGALMDLAELKAKEKNFSELNLATHVKLDENISLYHHLGWQETGRDDLRVFMIKQI